MTSVVPIGALTEELGLVSPVNGWAEAYGKEIDKINNNDAIDGLIVQLPLPKHINEMKVTEMIAPSKDVDGFHPTNVGRMALDMPCFLPATPFGILELLERYNVQTSGQHVVVIGRSHIVGRPMSILMSQKRAAGDATVTIAHSRTKNLKSKFKQMNKAAFSCLVIAL